MVLDVGEDVRCHIAPVSCGNVGVCPDGVEVSGTSGGVCEVLLPHKREGQVGEFSCGNVVFCGHGVAEVNGAGASGVVVKPGDVTAEGDVDAVGGGAVAEATVALCDAAGLLGCGQEVGGEAWGGVEDDDVALWMCVEVAE